MTKPFSNDGKFVLSRMVYHEEDIIRLGPLKHVATVPDRYDIGDMWSKLNTFDKNHIEHALKKRYKQDIKVRVKYFKHTGHNEILCYIPKYVNLAISVASRVLKLKSLTTAKFLDVILKGGKSRYSQVKHDAIMRLLFGDYLHPGGLFRRRTPNPLEKRLLDTYLQSLNHNG